MEGIAGKHGKSIAVIAQLHKGYLGLLPALVTFAILLRYGHPAPMLLFLGGTVAVGVYLSVVAHYTSPPQSLRQGLLILLDGPLWILAATVGHTAASAAGIAVETFLVEDSAIWLAVLALALTSPLPTRAKRVGSTAFMVIALSATLALVWPYLQESLAGQWGRGLWLLAGILEAAVMRVRMLGKGSPVKQDEDQRILYIVGGIFAWVIALCAGVSLHGE